ncbi:hypothetical protein XarjCFBP7645_13650 [Xanthomonas arboricola]|uniref:Uncharacterized protein n=1 Tax=Xanthomonas arboricola TaxID=56448 RepID=A0A2S7A940_9XANT|nr:hypothetical protein XarjCFBP7645_13650 [Xanthomonas arboricola]
MPRKSLQGRTCGVSREGGRARALQPSHRSPAPRPTHPHPVQSHLTTTGSLSFSVAWMFQAELVEG